MAPSADSTASLRARYVQKGTRLAEDPRRRAEFFSAVEALEGLAPVLEGAFATNVIYGRYEVDGVLGQGAQGTTLSATDNKTGARVCIKLFDLRHATDWKAVDLFEREVATLRTLNHPRMPTLIEAHDDDDSAVRALVMTRVLGETFDAFADSEGPLNEATLWRLLDDAAEVLTVLHDDQGIVHRDIKPQNLVRMPDGRCGLIDFGGVTPTKKSAGSTVVGTLGYMAPEQLYGRATSATDIYALGASVLHLATGIEPEHLPRKGLSLDVDSAVPQLSPPLRDVLKAMIAPDPDARPQDAAALRRRLNAAPSSHAAPRKRKWWQSKTPHPAEASETVASPEGAHSPYAAPKFEAPLQTGASQEVTSVMQIGIGIVGTIALVAFFDVFLSLMLTVFAAFANGKTKTLLLRTQKDLARFADRQKRNLARGIDRGALALKEAEHKERRQRAMPKARGQNGPHAGAARRRRRDAGKKNSKNASRRGWQPPRRR